MAAHAASTGGATTSGTAAAVASGAKPGAGRKLPNILICGTPGTGKTCTASLIAEATQMRHVNIGDFVKEKQLYSERDEEYDCLVIDEDALCDELEPVMQEGGIIVDFHGADLFPERWFDLVLVLRTDNTILYDRLAKRGYAQKKLQDNVTCEIMQCILEEARNAYEAVHEVQSNTVDDLEANVERVQEWLRAQKL